MEKVTEYIKKVTGLKVSMKPTEKQFLNKLPLFIRKGFRFFEGMMAGRDLLFIFPAVDALPVPKQLQAQIERIESLFGNNVVLILDDMDQYMRGQLTRKRIAFVVPWQQMYIPFMFIVLDERIKKKLAHVETFYPATQTLLIYHLWKMPLNGLNLKEIATHLDYAAMTVTRAVRELESIGICITHGGRQKILKFEGTNREIWDQAKPYMKNPVINELKWVDADADEGAIAGMNALTYYTSLDAGYENTLAVKKKTFNKQEQMKIAAEPGDTNIQLWSYDPALLAKNEFIDPFSLYLTMQDNLDERVQISLEEMMEAVL